MASDGLMDGWESVPDSKVFPGEVKDLVCPDCGSPMKLRESKHGPFYGCTKFPTCRAAHGAHPDGRPLGIPGTKDVKELRIRAHEIFDQLWQRDLVGSMGARTPGRKGLRYGGRNAAYQWLAEQLGLPRADCHIGSFDDAMCKKVIQVCQQRLRQERTTP